MNALSPKKAELHTHLGAAVDPVVLWTIAHQQGIRLPVRNYWDFQKMITMSGDKKNESLHAMDKDFFHWTELIQSSPEALEMSVHSVIGGGYRKCNLTLQELRFNPMLRNRAGERDLDHIILAALWGMRRAVLEYPEVKAGVILMMDRRFSLTQNEIIVEKAIRYMNDGIIGVDVAGPDHPTFSMEAHAPLFERARNAGLGITVHTGEVGNIDEMEYVIKNIKPDRIGHGVMAAAHPHLLELLRSSGITLEVCPTSNLRNSVLPDVETLKRTLRTFIDSGVAFTINTDGPEMYQTNVLNEEMFLQSEGILSEAEVATCTERAFNASFIKTS
ncbi:MAG: amidohydrolase family protein [Patescibacteria group bacterium]